VLEGVTSLVDVCVAERVVVLVLVCVCVGVCVLV